MKSTKKQVVYFLIKDKEVIGHITIKSASWNKLSSSERTKRDKAIYEWLKSFENELPLQMRIGDNFDNYVDFDMNTSKIANPKFQNKRFMITAKFWDDDLKRLIFNNWKAVNIGIGDYSYWADKNFLNGYRIHWSSAGYFSKEDDMYNKIEKYEESIKRKQNLMDQKNNLESAIYEN